MHTIIIEPTANPNVMKFVADYTLIPGSLELDRTSDISEIPLAQELFNYPFVSKVFISANFVAVAKEDHVEWEHIAESLKNVIEDELLANPRIYRQKPQQRYEIFAEMTPNPAVMKFGGNRLLLDGFVEVKSREEADEVPLAKALYDEFKFVKEVFVSENFVAVTKDDSVQWHVVMGKDCSIWYNAVIRGDVHYIKLGNKVNVQDNVMLHCTYEKFPLVIGNNVSIGHNACVHGCTIHDNVLIGMSSVVMDNCLIESNSIVAAGSVVTQGTHIRAGELWGGVPAKKIKDVSQELISGEIDRIANNYVKYSSWYKDGQ